MPREIQPPNSATPTDDEIAKILSDFEKQVFGDTGEDHPHLEDYATPTDYYQSMQAITARQFAEAKDKPSE